MSQDTLQRCQPYKGVSKDFIHIHKLRTEAMKTREEQLQQKLRESEEAKQKLLQESADLVRDLKIPLQQEI